MKLESDIWEASGYRLHCSMGALALIDSPKHMNKYFVSVFFFLKLLSIYLVNGIGN